MVYHAHGLIKIIPSLHLWLQTRWLHLHVMRTLELSQIQLGILTKIVLRRVPHSGD